MTHFVFDYDGTLARSDKTADGPLKEFSEQKGLCYNAAKLSMGYMDPERFDLGWGLPHAQQAVVLSEYYSFAIARFEDYPNTHPYLFDGVIEMLDELSQHNTLYIATARDRKTASLSIHNNQIEHYFAGIVTYNCMSDLGLQIKPSRDMITHLENNYGLCTKNAVMIGDTEHDIMMAQNAGLKSIAITHGNHSKDMLKEMKPDYMVDNIPQLHRLLLTL